MTNGEFYSEAWAFWSAGVPHASLAIKQSIIFQAKVSGRDARAPETAAFQRDNSRLCRVCYNRLPRERRLMFRERAKLYNRLQFAADILMLWAAFGLSYATRMRLSAFLPENLDSLLNPSLLPFSQYLWIVGMATGCWMAAAFPLGLYRISMRRSDLEKIRIVLESSIIVWLFLGFLSFALRLNLSRPLIAIFVFYMAVILTATRLLLALQAKRKRAALSPKHCRNIVIIGPHVRSREMGKLISRYSDWGFRILGYIDLDAPHDSPRRPDALGSLTDLDRIIDDNIIDEVIYVPDRPSLEGFDQILEPCNELGIRVRVAADFFPAKVTKVSMEFLEKVPVLSFSSAPEHAPSLFFKRVLDVILSATLLLLLLPFMIVIGILVRLTSKGPALYKQVRCGLYGRKFTLYKIRSMYRGAEDVLWEIKHLNEMDGPVFKMRNDPRVTPLGRFLRRSSIDELPQFWNVLKGDMSLVGPRAPLPEEVKEYTRWQKRRLSVKPGITCLWQISGRNEIDFHEWMKLDLHYIDHWSLLLDFKILLRTFPVVLIGKGAR
jgi:exopolysaccharide biosynthesis polyprenyl glycosylphosphotransferase